MMNWRTHKRQRKKLRTKIQERDRNLAKKRLITLGGGIMLPCGWIYSKKGDPIKLMQKN